MTINDLASQSAAPRPYFQCVTADSPQQRQTRLAILGSDDRGSEDPHIWDKDREPAPQNAHLDQAQRLLPAASREAVAPEIF